MKKIFQFFTLTAMAATVWCACKKDMGNYTYADPNSLTITTDMANVDPQVVVTNDSVVVRENDSLTINIIVAGTKSTDNLSYQWMITQSAATIGNPVQYIVGNNKQLKTKIIVPPNLYRLLVKVTDNNTGVSFYKFYQLNVDTSPWGGEGWVILQDQPTQGGSDISVITSRDGLTHGKTYPNVYSLENGQKLPTGTYKVNVINYQPALRIQKVSFFYPNGGLQVKSTDFTDSSNHNSWFLVTPSAFNFQANGQVSGGQYEYIFNNNVLTYRAVNPNTIATAPIKFGAPLLGTWTLSPFVMNNAISDYYYTLYDQANKCFLLYNVQTNTLTPTNRPDVANSHFVPYSGAASALNATTGSGFDLNNIGRNLVYAENAQPLVSGTQPVYDCIFRNNAGDSSFLYQIPINLAYTNNFTTGRFFLSQTNNPGINSATMFACPTFLTMPGKFYYVNANNIYVCTVGNLATSTSSIGYTFPAGTIIKSMKVFKSGYASAPSTESKVLVVATDETASGGGNKVYFLNLSATGTINGTPADVYSGFDAIRDISFKKALGL